MNTKDTLQAYFDSLRAKGEWGAFFSDTVQFTSFASPVKRVTGRDEFLEATRGFYAMIQAVDIKRTLVDGDRACVLTRYDLQPPSGSAFESHVAELFEVRDGKIRSFGIYFDSAPFSRL
jgi:ketosteroid isomerase-like protein